MSLSLNVWISVSVSVFVSVSHLLSPLRLLSYSQCHCLFSLIVFVSRFLFLSLSLSDADHTFHVPKQAKADKIRLTAFAGSLSDSFYHLIIVCLGLFQGSYGIVKLAYNEENDVHYVSPTLEVRLSLSSEVSVCGCIWRPKQV